MDSHDKVDCPYIKERHFKKKRKSEEAKRTYIFVDHEKK
jgi:hypothetical protein